MAQDLAIIIQCQKAEASIFIFLCLKCCYFLYVFYCSTIIC